MNTFKYKREKHIFNTATTWRLYSKKHEQSIFVKYIGKKFRAQHIPNIFGCVESPQKIQLPVDTTDC